MKSLEANDEASIRALLDHLNVCHDGWLRRISFLKDRQYDKDGNVFYPYEEEAHEIKCDIDVELLLDSYVGALRRQIVALSFKGVSAFRFSQDSSFDYSEIYEVTFREVGDGTFEFSFREASKRVVILSLSCSGIICKEYVQPGGGAH